MTETNSKNQRSISQRSIASGGQYLVFVLNQQAYGVAISTVREINRVTEITPIPKTPLFVAGVMNLRGSLVPVVNLRLKFGLELAAFTKHTCIIVIESEHGPVGMIVDAVSGVQDLQSMQIEAPPAIGEDPDQSFINGMGKIGNQVIILIDIVHALSKDELIKKITSDSKVSDLKQIKTAA